MVILSVICGSMIEVFCVYLLSIAALLGFVGVGVIALAQALADAKSSEGSSWIGAVSFGACSVVSFILVVFIIVTAMQVTRGTGMSSSQFFDGLAAFYFR